MAVYSTGARPPVFSVYTWTADPYTLCCYHPEAEISCLTRAEPNFVVQGGLRTAEGKQRPTDLSNPPLVGLKFSIVSRSCADVFDVFDVL